ncbi:hypothetical protein CK503_13895 [Aliifodinibius salipaludis]|uniref:HTH araC/xylS-type domain-containing protein n=1 Tax=Fodinibius salipaludis TaxID=2032627 RepID=A0A2A2G5V3_9BACT|nr:AraC family transcriptional regulator [Aliifodinibius salipaludis]PAU93011.1 hypothetical protein CK503_13895 [Aliifodinibius salipaludis]
MKPLQPKKIKENYRLALPEPTQGWPRQIKRAFAFIKEHLFNRHLNVKWVKTQCYINSKGFSYRFYKHVNRYPKDYILRHRIKVAKEILHQTDMPVTTAAISVGFNSHSAFANSFKTREDLTPTQWREQN